MLELRRVGLGQEAPEGEITTTPILVQRGFVAVPTPDVQEYVRSQALTFGAGVVLGISIGAIFGNLLTRKQR